MNELINQNVVKIALKNKNFTLSSGIKSPIYLDTRLVNSNVTLRKKVTKGLIGLIKKYFSNANCIAGVATGGIPHASYISLTLNLPLVYIRKNSKKHGLKRKIEGKIPKNANVVVVEDLLSTGQSAKMVVDCLTKEKHKVLGVIAIFSYQFKALSKNLAEIQNYSLLSFTELIKTLSAKKEINYLDIKKIKNFWETQNKI